MNLRLALRNLARHRLRTWLTAGGVAIAVAMLIWLTGFMEAMFDLMLRKATETQLGDAQIHTQAYVEEPSMYEHYVANAELLARLEAAPGVRAAAPRVQSFGLLGHEKTSQIAQLTGVDPAREPTVTTVSSALARGTWLQPVPSAPQNKPVVLGVGLARLLNADVGDELVVLLQGVDGSMGNEVLVVGGILATGSTELDRQVAFLRLTDLQDLLALDDHVMEIALAYERGAPLAETTAAVAGALPAGLTVRTWKELVPELAQMIELSRGSSLMMYLIVYFLAGLGILNTQRMSALERRREMGVMMAVGLTPRRLGMTVIYETLTLVALGGALGTLLGFAINAYFAKMGLDMSLGSGSDESLSYAGITFDEPIIFQLTGSMFVSPLIALFVVGLLCSLWPAISSARLDVVRAISGRAG